MNTKQLYTKISKAKFEGIVAEQYQALSCRAYTEEEVRLTLYYDRHTNKHIGTWHKGGAWVYANTLN